MTKPLIALAVTATIGTWLYTSRPQIEEPGTPVAEVAQTTDSCPDYFKEIQAEIPLRLEGYVAPYQKNLHGLPMTRVVAEALDLPEEDAQNVLAGLSDEFSGHIQYNLLRSRHADVYTLQFTDGKLSSWSYRYREPLTPGGPTAVATSGDVR